jgi:hypothetical protein
MPAERVLAVRRAENRDGARSKQPIKIMWTHVSVLSVHYGVGSIVRG